MLDLPEAYRWTQQQHMMEAASKHNNFVSQFYHPTTKKATATASASAADMFCTQNIAFGFNLNKEEEEFDEQLVDERVNHSKEELEEHEILKEALFEKPLTPSDVGKFNCLVIPKQHVESTFHSTVVTRGERDFLLGFEDEIRKSWKFGSLTGTLARAMY